MAAMFAEAEAEQALLLLDEADSFLLDRRGAQRHHELSEVNEMLQGMERFRGIFVCTTNLLERIDAAALRRFSFKILFKPLRPEQRLALFAREALGAAEARWSRPSAHGCCGWTSSAWATTRRSAASSRSCRNRWPPRAGWNSSRPSTGSSPRSGNGAASGSRTEAGPSRRPRSDERLRAQASHGWCLGRCQALLISGQGGQELAQLRRARRTEQCLGRPRPRAPCPGA